MNFRSDDSGQTGGFALKQEEIPQPLPPHALQPPSAGKRQRAAVVSLGGEIRFLDREDRRKSEHSLTLQSG